MKLKDLKDKKILILGFGKEGRNTFQALRYLFPKKELAIADKKKINILFKNINLFTGDNYLKVIKDYNIIIKTPGISFKKIKPYLNSKKKVTSQTELFLNNFQGKVIGITGTKGKGTSASLIYNILKNNGFKVGLGGNIGKPVLYDLVKKRIPKIFVYELSAQQLENINCSPHIAVFLNLYPAHLNFFQNIKKYKKAKSNICLYQNKEDYFIFYKNQDFLKKLSKKTKAKTISFKEKEIKKIKEKLGNIYLKGDFNYLNILAAFKVAKMFNITENK